MTDSPASLDRTDTDRSDADRPDTGRPDTDRPDTEGGERGSGESVDTDLTGADGLARPWHPTPAMPDDAGDSAAAIEEQERQGWPDEPTTS